MNKWKSKQTKQNKSLDEELKKIKTLTISTWIFLLVNDCSLGREWEKDTTYLKTNLVYVNILHPTIIVIQPSVTVIIRLNRRPNDY